MWCRLFNIVGLRYGILGRLLFVLALIVFFNVILPKTVKAVNYSATVRGTATAQVVEKTLTIDEVNNNLVYEFSSFEEGTEIGENISQWQGSKKSEELSISRLNVPFTIFYGTDILSKKAVKENEQGYSFITLENKQGEKVKAKLKLKILKMEVDKNGKNKLALDSDLIVSEKQEPNNYKGGYYIIMFY